MVRPITPKQIKLLQLLRDKGCVIATWSQQDLVDLRVLRFVTHQVAYSASGNLASNCIWVITEAGQLFLAEERAGV